MLASAGRRHALMQLATATSLQPPGASTPLPNRPPLLPLAYPLLPLLPLAYYPLPYQLTSL